MMRSKNQLYVLEHLGYVFKNIKMENEINLKQFLMGLEDDQRVLPSDDKVLQVQQGVEKIVQDIIHDIEREDGM